MKLSFLKLKAQEKIGANAATDEFIPELFGDIELDLAARTVTIGEDVFPLEHVRRMRGVTKEYYCPECAYYGRQNSFADARALGAHRRHKHDVLGKRAAKRAVPEHTDNNKLSE